LPVQTPHGTHTRCLASCNNIERK